MLPQASKMLYHNNTPHKSWGVGELWGGKGVAALGGAGEEWGEGADEAWGWQAGTQPHQ